MSNKNFLTDPIFSSYAAPLQLPLGFPKRIREVHEDLKIEKLPKIDYVVVSHNHYDHLDNNSIQLLKKIHDPIFIVPSQLNIWFHKNGISKVVDLNRWNSHKENDIEINFLPAQHWSHRTTFDRFDKIFFNNQVVKHFGVLLCYQMVKNLFILQEIQDIVMILKKLVKNSKKLIWR